MAGLKPSLYALVLQESRRITKAGEHSNPVTRSFYILLWCGIFFVYAEVGMGEPALRRIFPAAASERRCGDFSGGDFGQLRVRDAVVIFQAAILGSCELETLCPGNVPKARPYMEARGLWRWGHGGVRRRGVGSLTK